MVFSILMYRRPNNHIISISNSKTPKTIMSDNHPLFSYDSLSHHPMMNTTPTKDEDIVMARDNFVGLEEDVEITVAMATLTNANAPSPSVRSINDEDDYEYMTENNTAEGGWATLSPAVADSLFLSETAVDEIMSNQQAEAALGSMEGSDVLPQQ